MTTAIGTAVPFPARPTSGAGGTPASPAPESTATSSAAPPPATTISAARSSTAGSWCADSRRLRRPASTMPRPLSANSRLNPSGDAP
jgi:hypothetical protein